MRAANVVAIVLLTASTPFPLSAAVPASIMRDLVSTRSPRVAVKSGDLPKDVQNALARTFQQKKLKLADAGEPFQRTDLVTIRPGEKLLPRRRLLFGFGTSQHFVVYYESSSVGLGANALVYSTAKPGSARLVWGGVEVDHDNLAKDPDQLIRRLRRGKLIDDQPFIW
jgi:hypothetical protein